MPGRAAETAHRGPEKATRHRSGPHLFPRGLALNGNLLAAGARFVRETTTAPEYRLWSIGDRHPAMVRVREDGAAIALEIWEVPEAGFAAIVLAEPAGSAWAACGWPTAARRSACWASRRSVTASARSRAGAAGAHTWPRATPAGRERAVGAALTQDPAARSAPARFPGERRGPSIAQCVVTRRRATSPSGWHAPCCRSSVPQRRTDDAQ